LKDPENNIYRPRQNYTGYPRRDFVDINSRKEGKVRVNPIGSKKRIRIEASRRYKSQSEGKSR
jgi:hypothetical protein